MPGEYEALERIYLLGAYKQDDWPLSSALFDTPINHRVIAEETWPSQNI